ncbi:YqeG family HAD IIIA-type phosphatase [Priestia sp. SB1]|uniref:YqeG family HAD IIIA-type phosphatase n=1 Tax=Priestia sp. SB1 TaxID=3132359 RepID=UPI003176683B
MINYLKPAHFLTSFFDIDEKFLKEKDIKVILSDLDGTLAAENEMGDDQFEEWLKSLRELGINLIIVSNNNENRVKSFIDKYGISGIGKSGKPATRRIKQIAEIKDIELNQILFLGDQLFTDVWCAKRMGVQAAIVTPIPGKETWKTKIKRNPEKWLFKIWKEIR